NGCGKTTLFKTLLGLIPRQGGAALLEGADVAGLDRRAVARRVAYVPQAHAAVFPYAVRDMVLMGRTAHRGLFASPGPEDRDRAEAALAELGIAHLAGRDYTRISGGQRQLALIARALAQDAPLIVMDEPTASLDFGNQIVVLREVRRLAAAGYGVVLSTHNPDHAFLCADHAHLLHDGATLAAGPPADALTAERLSRIYGAEIEVRVLEDGRRVCLAREGPGEASAAEAAAEAKAVASGRVPR
ncbi:MAG: ABC transporter ATP-binding protein, partial [Pseudomonadota bacterium]